MKKNAVFFVVLVIALLISPAARAETSAGAGNPIEGIFLLKEGRAMRSSSADPAWRTGNNDWRVLGPGESITLADLDGPGLITHLWLTLSCRDRQCPKLLALRIYWDNEKVPSVEAPVGDFFAVGNGMDAPVDSLPVQVSSEGRARNSFWPMPFRKHAKVVITNENPYSSGLVIYWYVDWRKLDAVPADAAYFHAQYRQEYPARPGRYKLLETQGRGHYVGTVYSVIANMPGWIGEGDDFFYIDGEQTPSLRGTGTEDYFGDAWGFRTFNQPYHGVTVYEGEKTGARTTAYRWHLADPVPFTKSLRVEIEHVGPVFDDNDKLSAGYGERSDHFSTVAFWYQQGGSPNADRMPIGLKRLPPFIYVEAEKKYYAEKSVPEGVKIVTGPEWSGGAYVKFTPAGAKKRLDLKFVIKKKNRYEFSADLVRGPEMGMYSAALDGKQIGVLAELNNKSVSRFQLDRGFVELDEGEHKMTFDYLGPAPGGGDSLGIDGIYLRPVKFNAADAPESSEK